MMYAHLFAWNTIKMCQLGQDELHFPKFTALYVSGKGRSQEGFLEDLDAAAIPYQRCTLMLLSRFTSLV